MAPFTIPDELVSQLEVVENPDTRSTKDIIASLNTHVPVTSEKNIWAFWHSGLDNLPSWCQRNVADWVRICGPSWTVHVLDTVPDSPNHILNFVAADLLPEALVKGTMDGPYVGPHTMDFLRGALLIQHGGVAMDVGCILMRDMDRVCWNQIADDNSPFEVAVPVMYGQTIANHFTASRKGNPFITRWHKLFLHLWGNRHNYVGMSNNPALGFVKDIDFSEAEGWTWDFKIDVQQVLEYISQVMCWRRLTMLEDTGDGFNGSKYWQGHILGIDARTENWAAENLVGFSSGQRLYDLLSLPLDTNPESEDFQEAHKLVWHLLSSASWQKVTHGKGLTHSPHLGLLWDENDGKDSEPGTFGELLRWGAVNLRQKRDSIVTKETAVSPVILKEGLFGPLDKMN
ncbi:hypothetical protein HG530_004007 [Fusarium avenaceum]|nr:hypothetical protein HG530_004007 [Fusarium avenaceum]